MLLNKIYFHWVLFKRILSGMFLLWGCHAIEDNSHNRGLTSCEGFIIIQCFGFAFIVISHVFTLFISILMGIFVIFFPRLWNFLFFLSFYHCQSVTTHNFLLFSFLSLILFHNTQLMHMESYP